MPSVEHETVIAAPFAKVWPFVRNMNNWAPLVTGYQRHQELSETESVWHLKGELGGLTRIAEFKALVTEWDENGRVRFTLRGVNEPVTGEGSFLAEELKATSPDAGSPVTTQLAKTGLLARLRDVVARFIYGRIFAKNASSMVAVLPMHTGAVETRIIFRLTLTAGGMAGPVLNMLITPMLKPVAEDLANGIAGAIG